jgi:hypothetical protein
MWGAALFLITIFMVTQGGRDAASGYVERFASLFSGQIPGSDAALWVMALSALACFLVMRKRSPEKTVERWVWQIRVCDDDTPRTRTAHDAVVVPTR